MVQVATFDDSLRAHFTRTLLEDAAITVEVRDEFLVQADPLLSNAVGGIKIFVPESQAHRAMEILADERDGSLEGEMPESVSGLRCPKCGDRKMKFGRLFHVWVAIVVFLMVLPFVVSGEGALGPYRMGMVTAAFAVAFIGIWVAIFRKFPLQCPKCGFTGMRKAFEPGMEALDD